MTETLGVICGFFDDDIERPGSPKIDFCSGCLAAESPSTISSSFLRFFSLLNGGCGSSIGTLFFFISLVNMSLSFPFETVADGEVADMPMLPPRDLPIEKSWTSLISAVGLRRISAILIFGKLKRLLN